MNCVSGHSQNTDCSFFLSLSLHWFPSAVDDTDTWWIENSACCWCCRFLPAKFCLLTIWDEIRREIQFEVVSVRVNYWRDFRVVIDFVLRLITCVSGQVGQGARDRTTRRSTASWAWRRRHWSRKGHLWRRGRRRWKADVKMTMREQQRRWMKHVQMWIFLHKRPMKTVLEPCAHAHFVHEVCGVTMTQDYEKKCACNRWCSVHCEALQPPIVARVPLHLTSNDANHGQFRRLLNTLLETGSDILQTPTTREEALIFVMGPPQLGGTDPAFEPQPGQNLQSGQADHTLWSQCTCPLLRHTPLFVMDDSEPAADLKILPVFQCCTFSAFILFCP